MIPEPLVNGSTEVLSIRELALRRSGAAQLAAFTSHARAIAQASNLELMQEFEQQDDPLMLWVAHREADSRHLPPCLRWGACTLTPMQTVEVDIAGGRTPLDGRQPLFVNWLADMLWLAGRDRSWRPLERRWSPLFDQEPNSAGWHVEAVQLFHEATAEPVAFTAGLGLAKRTRLDMLTLATQGVQQDRAALLDVAELTQRLTGYATEHPDRSGVFTPAQVVQRRLLAHRVFMLANRQQGLAAQYLGLLTGQSVSRQAFTRQLAAIAESTGTALPQGFASRKGTLDEGGAGSVEGVQAS